MNGSADASDVFRQEAAEILDGLETTLLDLERSPDDKAVVDAAFRAMHTIKGSGAMFGFVEVAEFTHAFETAFDLVRKGKIKVSGPIIAVSLRALDFIRTSIETPDAATEADGRAILADLEVTTAGRARSPATPQAAPDREIPSSPPRQSWRIRFRFRGPVLANGTNPLDLIDELRGLGPCTIKASADGIPHLSEIDPEVCWIAWSVELAGGATRDDIEAVFMFCADDMDLDIEPVDGTADASPSAEHLSALRPAPEPVGDIPATRTARDVDAADPQRSASASDTVRVPAGRLDDLMDRVGELVIQHARLAQFAEQNGEIGLKAIAEDIGRLAAGLRDTTMNIRLVPIGSLFNRFRRMVHDVGRDLGKSVELVTEGEETELDKTVIERLADPLTHIIRNALDHGIETGDARAAAGKPASGRLHLRAQHVGAEVQILVGDDGRGLDRGGIRRKAEEAGLVAPGAIVADLDLLRLIFEPGFSTARQVSALSGRGVGMDVVKRTVEALRGRVDIETEAGHGTEIKLRLPLTLAIIEGLLVELAGNRYVIPLGAVQECVELDADGRLGGRSLLDIRGELVPFIRLRELFGKAGEDEPHQKVVIVSSNEIRVGLVVDRIIGSHQTVIKSLSKLHADVKTFSGATILADGSAALIFDIPQLVERGQSHARRVTFERQEAA